MLSLRDFRERWVVRIWNDSTIFAGAYNMTHLKHCSASNAVRPMVTLMCIEKRKRAWKPQNMPAAAVVFVCISHFEWILISQNIYEFQVQYQVYHRIIGFCFSSLPLSLTPLSCNIATQYAQSLNYTHHAAPDSNFHMHKIHDAQCDNASVASVAFCICGQIFLYIYSFLFLSILFTAFMFTPGW